MRLAFVGKGGAGKSSVAGTLCRQLGRLGHPVLALDVDTMPGLAMSLGAGSAEARLPGGLFEVSDGRWRLVRRTSPARLVDRHAVIAPDGVRLLELGKLPGRVEPSASVAFRWVMESFRRPGWAKVADLAAGTRQPMFRWARFADMVVIVVEATSTSVLSARRLQPVATHVLVNKARTSEDADMVRRALPLPLLGVIPYDPAVAEADRRGVALIDHAPTSAAVATLAGIASTLTSGLE